MLLLLFFFTDTATTEIYTLSLHDALPISRHRAGLVRPPPRLPRPAPGLAGGTGAFGGTARSEEHTSELQSRRDLVCRLLLEKKKNIIPNGFEVTSTNSIANTCLIQRINVI